MVNHDVNVPVCSARWKTPCYVGIHTTVAQLVEPPSQVIPRISETGSLYISGKICDFLQILP